MQRLYSMFPGGGPGIGLLLLRSAVAAALVLEAPFRQAELLPDAGMAVPIVLAAGLAIGVVTPVFAVLACLFAVLAAHAGADAPTALVVLLDAAALALLGPGAYSLDARLFGRRVVVLAEKRGPKDG